jgi:N-acetylglucosamine malate deacetylase 1
MKNTKKNQTAIVFGAHPDDIEIGMAGTVAKLGKLGYDVKLVIANTPDHPKGMVDVRKTESKNAAKIMGCDPPEFLDLKCSEYIFNRTLVGRLDKIIEKHKPEVVFTQWVGDSHQDHQILTRCVLAASRRIDNVLMYETTVPSLITDVPFGPRMYVDISPTIEIKRKAVECHQTQAKLYGPLWIKAIIGRSAFRGFQIRKPYAEVFEVTKIVKW